jgi:hypothetical protein
VKAVQNLDRIIQHLEKLEHDFYGEVVIRVRDGQAVLITEERSFKIEPDDRGDDRERR